MSKEALKMISDAMSEMGLSYEFMEWTSEPVYPYFTGEYQEIEASGEDGQQETAFLLNGFARESGEGKTAYLELEEAKETIKAYFPAIGGKKAITDKGSVIAIFYANGLVVPTGNDELKRLQIDLMIKEWRVN